ncbi:MAG: phenylalanine--tRNA ligase subunit beta [Clostridiales bacterium]|nr:phenylalanine--tRNA ligase subunit beta [Clostridiales bacterium]
MKLPKSWLTEYVNFDISDAEFIERMMHRGFEPEGVERELEQARGVLTGRIMRMEAHPNAARLRVCQVDMGTHSVQIVTNATNVREGAIVPVAVVGAEIGETTFTAATLRGVESYGMFCGCDTLGVTLDACVGCKAGEDGSGVLILPEGTPVGIDIAQALDMTDTIFDFSVTPNRPDCNSIIGLAREAAAALGQPLTTPGIPHIASAAAGQYASVRVEESLLCPRYTARVLRNIKIEPSPLWMQQRLRRMGQRPINNIVDITNYNLLEWGHPLHAFDLSCVTDGQIIVRKARAGEVVTTLDGKERPLDTDTLVIADANRPVAIAGVMGGANSEITDQTETVLLESAVFYAAGIRRTSKRLRHSTDSSVRFAKGVEAVNCKLALKRATQLIVELGAGEAVGEVLDVCAAELAERVAIVDIDHVNNILGLSIAPERMIELLATISIHAQRDNNTLRVQIPHWRTDIETGIQADADIAEEIGRLAGLSLIAPALLAGDSLGSIPSAFRAEDLVKDALAACGALEMYNYNFSSPAALALFGFTDERTRTVRLQNPFGEEQSLMRSSLYPGMLESAARNLRRKTGHGRFFEVGNIHIDAPGLPVEHKKIGLCYFGEDESFYTLKGSIERLLETFRVQNIRYTAAKQTAFQPGRCAEIWAGATKIGEMGQLHPDVTNSANISQPLYMAELSFAALLAASGESVKFTPIPRFPVVQRDLAVVVDDAREAAELASIIENTETDLIISDIRLFDVYRGANLPAGKKSLAYSFTLRAEDRTLSDAEIQSAFAAVIAALAANNAPIRS